MKRWIPVILTLCLVFTLASCGSKGNEGDAPSNQDNGASQTQKTDKNSETSSVNIGDIFSGKGDTNTVYGKMSAAEKKALEDQAKEAGCTVSFGADGSTTLTNKDGDKYKQSSDGSWSYEGANGETLDIGSGKWPDNEFTKLVPKPDMDISATATENNKLSVVFANASVDKVKAYVEKLKNAGFTVDADTVDQTVGDMDIFSYTSDNSSGVHIEITYSAGTGALVISK